MAKKDNKKVMEKAIKINDAWAEAGSSSNFSGVKQDEYDNDIKEILGIDVEIVDTRAKLKMLEDKKDGRCVALDAKSVRVANGVRGDAEFGPDSLLYGAMGFIRTSERKSGLTRKSKK